MLSPNLDVNTKTLKIGDQCVHFSLAGDGFRSTCDILIGIRNADHSQRTHVLLHRHAINFIFCQPGITGHDGLGDDVSRVDPLIGAERIADLSLEEEAVGEKLVLRD